MKAVFFISQRKQRVLPDNIGQKILDLAGPKYKYFSVYPEKFKINSKKVNTLDLLQNKKVQDFIKKQSGKEKPNIIVFKNTVLIEELCKNNKYNLLAVNAKISNCLENKITQADFLEINKIPRPLTVWGKLEDLDFYRLAMKLGLPFVLQFGRGHSGLSSKFIKAKKQYLELQQNFPLRKVKCTKFIKGEVGTMNLCLTKKNLVYGAPSLQITGIPELTSNPLSTVGNDWIYIQKLFKKKNTEEKFKKVVNKLAKAMRKLGYKGIFGIDWVFDAKDKKQPIKIIEINARFPASLANETEWALKFGNPILILHHLQQFLPELKFKRSDRIYAITTKKDYMPYYNFARILLRRKSDNEEIKCEVFDSQVYLGKGRIEKKVLTKITGNS